MAYQNLNYSGASINNLLNKCDNASSGGSTSDYITSSTMSSTYLTKTSASSTYQPIGSYMTTSTYNSLLDQSTATTYNNNLNTYFNTYCNGTYLLNKYYPVGSVMLTRCFYNDSTYGTKLIDPADLVGGSWTLMTGVIYQTGTSGSIGSKGSDSVTIYYNNIATASITQETGSATISHTHTCENSKSFYACQATFGEANRNSPAGSGYYYPRISSGTNISGDYVPQNSNSHGSGSTSNISNTMTLSTLQPGINIGIWRRTS